MAGRQRADFGLDRGWSWVVLAASFMSFMVIGGAMYSVGLLHVALLEKYQDDIAKTAWAAGLNSALVSGAGPLSSFLIDRYSCRVAMMTAGMLMTSGYVATAFAPNLELAIFTCGIIAGLGGAAGYTASMVVIGFNFERRRNIAMGVAVSGVGGGLFVLAPLIQFSKEYYGTFGFFLVLAAVMLHLIVFGALCRPSELEMETQRMRQLEAKLINNSKNKEGKEGKWSNVLSSLNGYVHVLTNRAVICLCLSMFTYCLGTHLLFLHLPSYSVFKGFSHRQSSFFLSIMGIMSIAGRLLTGFAATFKKVGDITLYAASMAILTICTFLFPFYSESYIGQVAYYTALGFFFGSCYVVLGSINITYVGVQYMSASIGIEFMFGGTGAVIGPIIAGFILDRGGTYESTLMVAGFCSLLGMVFGLAARLFGQPVTITQEEEVSIAVKSEHALELLELSRNGRHETNNSTASNGKLHSNTYVSGSVSNSLHDSGTPTPRDRLLSGKETV